MKQFPDGFNGATCPACYSSNCLVIEYAEANAKIMKCRCCLRKILVRSSYSAGVVEIRPQEPSVNSRHNTQTTMNVLYRDTGFGQLREWIEPAMHDFQARLQWCVTPEYSKANHKPIIEVPNGLDYTVMSGDTVRLEAVITDPDPIDVDALWLLRGDMWWQKGTTKEMVAQNPQKYHVPWRSGWYQYPAGTYKGNVDLHMGSEREAKAWFVAPEVTEPQTIHIILEAYDITAPRLTAYARYIITVIPKTK